MVAALQARLYYVEGWTRGEEQEVKNKEPFSGNFSCQEKNWWYREEEVRNNGTAPKRFFKKRNSQHKHKISMENRRIFSWTGREAWDVHLTYRDKKFKVLLLEGTDGSLWVKGQRSQAENEVGLRIWGGCKRKEFSRKKFKYRHTHFKYFIKT